MYLQGYTPEQIMAALHKKMLRETKERADAEEIPVVMPEIYKAYTKQVSSRRFTISM